ncbi:hypothetical protein [Nocardioides sp. LHG3406-4]|uniref:hypothetical protein n=1 Tax=Nocardioides sp. LHG3406-4 TaxID=2804575 RepID=UPI003CEF2767
MTEQDLATLVRDHVSYDEPAFQHSPVEVVTRGRRVVRRRRVLAGLAGAAVLTVGAVALPQLRSEGPGTDRVIDPAITQALDAYDAAQMPRIMDDHARSVFSASVPDLGPAEFVAFDSQSQELPPRYWDRASGLAMQYGADSEHRLSLTVEHARSFAEGDPDRYCAEGLDAGYYVECSVDRTPDGDVAITTLSAKRPMRDSAGLQAWNDNFMAVTADELPSIAPDRLWFSSDVKVIKSETFVTFTSETVRAPDLATARERLVVPTADLARIGLDPALVMPVPPRGERGCPQWTMPTKDMTVSCTADAG